MPPRLLKTSVRELVGFVLRSGDLVSGGFSRPDRLVEGTRGHQQVQRARPADYQAEVPISYLVETDDIALEISGRIDGLLVEDDTVLVEEIKTTEAELDEVPENPAHWAQAKLYAFMVAEQSGLDAIDVQLTYLQLDTHEHHEDRRTFACDELAAFCTDLIERYLRWARLYQQWCAERDISLEEFKFPFAEFRPGQRDLAAATYRTIDGRGRAFAQAPTGIGKTISTLFPAAKALGLGHAEKIFYLTAKTSGRRVAEKAIDDLREGGARLKSLTLTARDKICFKPNGGSTCDPEQCEFARGYYDRINDALEDIFTHDAFTRTRIEECAQKHTVCPFEFSLDLAPWCDVIICDYNYVFDPRAFLKRFFQDTRGQYAFLIDEAHNLVDRAREMFSADLCKSEISGLKRLVGKTHPDLSQQLDALNRYFAKLGKKVEQEGDGECWVSPQLSTDLMALVHNALRAAEKVLERGAALPFWDELIECYFRLLGFERIGELFDEHYTTYTEKQGRDIRFRLFCLDPAHNIRQALARGCAAVFFSATLSPLAYFRDLLGGEEEDTLLSLGSPFPPEHLRLLLADHIETTYKKRGESYGDVAESIAALVSQRAGNYLAFFPSYKYMEEVATRFAEAHPNIDLLVQESGMSDRDREAFLSVFDAEPLHPGQHLVGFAVMGGVFGEGIDLVGERLVGAVVVGVGLPQLCLERDLIRHYFDEREIPGFAYAYVYPGMNRVLQAAGRVIRTASDRGAILLVDRRFAQSRYRQLFPPSWHPVHSVRNPAHIAQSLADFWHHDPTHT